MTVHQPISFEPASITASHRYRLRARHIDQTFVIDVALPPVPVTPGQKLPVIFVTDGSSTFPLAAQTARLLQFGPYPLPPAIVVGIGYPTDTNEEWAMTSHLRTRDLSPWVDESVERRYRNAPEPWRLPDHIRQGGAGAFLNFIRNEVKPFLAERYPVDLDDCTLVGGSMGGLFALYALITMPEAFKRYVAMSPALYWDERRMFLEEAVLSSRRTDLPVHLFLSVGALEETMDVESRFVSNLYEFEARLRRRAYPNLDLHFHVFPDETHMSVLPAALSRGLSAVFGGHRNIHDWARVLDA
jgi:predicted alpha/beta superfamily hydrolase